MIGNGVTTSALDWDLIEEEARHFRLFGMSDREIADRLGVEWNSWEKHQERTRD